ncbi:MAG: choice-of-anchor D domain-containing protein [Bacteroidetes bacterium]|nr:choice-of-anchor D domain-containing protein [Bacteroidota bacterium]
MVRRLLRRPQSIALLLAAIALLTAGALHAQPVVVSFPTVPCDSAACDSVVITNGTTESWQLIALDMRDSTSYRIGPGVSIPTAIPSNSRLNVPVCFVPERRGAISDSLLIIVATAHGNDSIRVRLTGRGSGPALDVTPSVLNFPKTNPGANAVLPMVIHNNGEGPYTLDASNLSIPLPFVLQTTLPQVILPGDSLIIQVMFKPDSNGIYSVAVNLPSGCTSVLQLGFNGVTDLIGTGAVIRLSKTGFNPANNEQIPCDSVRCSTLTFSNVGNAPLIVESVAWAIGSLGYTITNPIPTPFIVAPQASRDIEICISSRQRGMLRDTLLVTSNSRSSIAFGMLIDVSGSMKETMYCGATPSTRMVQAITQAKNFINRALLYLPAVGILDELAVTTYTTSNFGRSSIKDIFPLQIITDPARATALNAVNALTPQAGTPTGEAVRHMVDVVAKSTLTNRVIVLLTDGEADTDDQLTYPIAQVAAYAQQRGIRVFTIGIGLDPLKGGRQYLQSLANATGGQAYDASDCSSLQAAFEAITDLLSRGAKSREPFQIKILSPYIVQVQDVAFDSVYVKGTECHTITLTNAGEGNAVVDSVNFRTMLGDPTTEFSLGSGVTFPITIPESGQVQLTVCFTPDSIRMRRGKVTFYYNSCGAIPVSAGLSGPAWAEANLRITDKRIGLPGQTVTLPVYYDSTVSAYSVDTITYQMRWNKTMLDLRGVRPGAQSGGATLTAGPVHYGDREATVDIVATGNHMPGAGELAQLDFMVLRGDTLGTSVELTSGTFEDDNPRTILNNAGFVELDSTCFRSAKPINVGAAAKIAVGDASPTPASDLVVTLPVTADADAIITLELYSNDGTLLRQARRYDLVEGTNSLTIDLDGMASGSYYAIVRAQDGTALFRKILLAR